MSRQKTMKKLRNKKLEVTPKEFKKMQERATLEASSIGIILPLLIMRDKYGFGKVRLNQYITHMEEALDDLTAGRFTLHDVSEMLKEEVGIVLFPEEEK